MGWNSFDCFGATVTEAEVLENAEFMARHLRGFGWDHVVVDYCWSHPNPVSCTNPNQMNEFQPYLAMDGDFRLWPAAERFPSAANGAGFRPLADKVHALGLKFGIHIMRGLPRQAFYPGYPAVNLRHRALDMADPSETCKWLNHMFGIRVGTKAGQDYYDSIFRLYADWGVDFVKADDLSFPYHAEEIEMIDRARRRSGRPMMLSISPGPCPLEMASHISRFAELWRISADFWDDWQKLKEMFRLCAAWAPHRSAGAWPDADMLPIGRLSKRGPVGPEHESYFTPAEQRTLLTLWSLFGSPLFIGGNLPELDDATLSLLTNPEVLALQASRRPAVPADRRDYPETWIARDEERDAVHIGLFNLSDEPVKRALRWEELGETEPPKRIRDLWRREDLSVQPVGAAWDIPPHGCELLTLEFQREEQPARKQSSIPGAVAAA